MKADDFLDDVPTADAFLSDVEPAAGGGAAFTYRKPWRGGKLVQRSESVLQSPAAAGAFAEAPDPTENARALFNALTTNPELLKSPMYGAGAAVLERAVTGAPSSAQAAVRRAQVDNALAAERAARINAMRESTDQAYGSSPTAQAIAAPGRRLLSGVASVVGGVAGIPQLFGSDLGSETADAAGMMARANMPVDPGLGDEVLSGVGQVGPMAGGGVALRAMLARVLGEGAATGVATSVMGATGGAMSGNQVLDDLEFRGDLTDVEKRGRALFAAIVSGASGKVADRFLLPGADRMVSGPLQAGGRAFVAEGGQEGLDQATQNAMTDRALSEGVARASLVGGLVGGGVRIAGELGSDANQLAAALDADAQTFANKGAPQMVQQPVPRAVGSALPAPVPPPVPAAPPPPALGYDPEVSNSGIMVVDNAGNARPMTADEFLEADDVRQQAAAKEMSDAEIGLTPDVRRAQQERSDPADAPAPRETPELVRQLIARGWTPPTAQELRDRELDRQADVKDRIRERMGLSRPAEDVEPEEVVKNYAASPLIRAIADGGGIDIAQRSDTGVDKNRATRTGRVMPNPYNVAGKPLFRAKGLRGDALVETLVSRGYLTQQDVEQADAAGVGGSEELAYDLIRRELERPGSVKPAVEQTDAIAAQHAQRATEDLESQARAIGLDTRDMDEAQVSGALRRIERRRQQAQARQSAFDARREAAAEREAIRDETDIPDYAYADLDIAWNGGDNVSLPDAMRALGFTDQEIQDATANRPEGPRQVGAGDGASGRNEARGSQGPPAADQGNQGRQEGTGEGLTRYGEEDLRAQQERAQRAPELDERAQIEREAERQALTAQNAPEQRRDTTGDLLGGPTAADVLADRQRQASSRARPSDDGGLFASKEGQAYSANAPRRKYNRDQLDLFLDSEPDPSQAGPAIEGARRDAVAAVDDLHATGSILAQALSSDYAARQRVSLVGQKVESTEDLAVLAQVYRDPRFETFRVIFTDDTNKVVSQVGLTSRLPGSAAAIVGRDLDSYLGDLSAAARQRGAAKFFMLHNHPSGYSRASAADIHLTRGFATRMPGLSFEGHVVIDTNEYTVILNGQETSTYQKDFGQPKPFHDADWADQEITKPEDLMVMAKRLQVDEDAVTLVITDFQYTVRGITTIPSASVTDDRAQTSRTVLKATLKKKGAFVFAVARDSEVLKRLGHVLLDGIQIGPDGSAKSLGTMGVIPTMRSPFPSSRRTRLTADTSPDFAYLRPLTRQAPESDRRAAEPGKEFSQDQVPTGNTASQVRGALTSKFGPLINRMEQRGFLKIWDTVQAFNDGQSSENIEGAAAGYYDGKTAHLFADGIEPGSELGVFLHEVGEHASMEQMLGPQYSKLVARAKALVESGDPLAEAADARIPEDTAAEHRDSELLAYMIETVAEAGAKAPPSVRKWLADTLAALRAWWSQTGFNRVLDRYGQGIDLNPADIAALAVRAVRWKAQQTGAAGRGGMYARAYHGTPHTVDKFSTDKVGTGEGAQAYGWGLYFADKREIAEHYRDTLAASKISTRGNFFVRGKSLDGAAGAPSMSKLQATFPELARDNAKAESAWAALRTVQKAGSVEQALKDLRHDSAAVTGEAAEYFGGQLTWLEKNAKSLNFEPAKKGHIYEVEIPEDSEMLLWDKPLSQQPAKVRAVLESDSMVRLIEGLKRDGSLGDYSASEIQRLSGEDFYDMLRQANGDDQKAASDALAAMGIKGIKYLDNGSRNTSGWHITPPSQTVGGKWMVKSSDYNSKGLMFDTEAEAKKVLAEKEAEATYNYVVFSGDDVAIQGRFSRPARLSPAATATAKVFGGRANAPPAAPPSTPPSPTAANTLGGGAQPWTVPEPGTWDNMVRAVQNNKIDMKRVRDAIEAKHGRLTTDADAYLQEELYHGRVAARVAKLHREEVEPILRKIAVSGIPLDDVNLYLHARHAPERNAAMKAINPNMANNDALSGMSDTEAAKVMRDLQAAGKTAALATIASDIDQLLADTRTNLVVDGLEDAGVVQAWEKAYQHYVPLQRDIEGRPPKGMGFSVRGPESQRAVGSERDVVNILANIVTQAETAAIRAEKSEVGRSLLAMAQQFPNPDFWKVDVPPTKPRIDPQTGLVERSAIDPLYQTADNVLMIKDQGAAPHFIVFNKDNERAMQMARAMKNLDIQQVPKVIEYVGKVTRFMASLLTQRNPEFWFTNFARDVQGSAIQMNGTDAEGLQAKVLANLPDAFAGMRHVARQTGKATQWAQYAQELLDAGGTTGYMQIFENSDVRMKDLEREVARMAQGKADPRRLARQMLDFIDNYNDVIENGMRLAVFQAVRENGVSTERAASIAKNITVNFNRRGNASAVVNSLYMFFNAGVQGTARMAQALATSNKARVAVGTLAGVAFIMDMVNRAMAGDDDETGRNRYDLIPEFEKSRNWIIMNPNKPGSYVKVPLPLGFHVFHNGGRLISDFLGRKDPRNASEYGWAFAGTLIDAFSPVGGVASVSQLIAPSATDPIVQLAENKSFTGGPVYRSADQGFGQLDPKPAYTRHFENTPDVWKGASRMLNDITGGDKDKRGWIDVEPDILRHIFTAITGGPGRAVDRVVDTAQSSVRGQEVTAARLPFSSRFYGVNDDRQKERAYYEDLRRAARAKEDFDHFVKARRRDLAQEVLKEIGKGDAARGRRVIAEFERSKKDGRAINKRIRELQRDNIDDSAQAEQLAALKKGRVRVYSRALKETATEEE